MKRSVLLWCIAMGWTASALGQSVVDVGGQVSSNLAQATSVIGGGDSNSDADSIAVAEGGIAVAEGGDDFSYSGGNAFVYSPTSTSNYEGKTYPLGTSPAYLPLWQHGGWGTVKGYFANGPTAADTVYERTFNPSDPDDMGQLRGILKAIPHTGPIKIAAGLLNQVRTALGGPDRFHHGRGFEIASSLVRYRRQQGKPMMVFIDSQIEKQVLFKAGYAYVGKISVEGDDTRNWDQTYHAAIAEALPWDVDILLISGGMKGISVGSTTAFPNMALGYSQLDYSLSLGGGRSKGVTEAKGKPVLSGEAFSFNPRWSRKTSLPRKFYNSLKARQEAQAKAKEKAKPNLQLPTLPVSPQGVRGVSVSNELMEMAGIKQGQRLEYMNAAQSQINH